MKDKMILALLLGIISFSGNAFAAVKPTEAIPSKILDVTLTRNKITSIPDVVYEQVPQRGYPSRAMKMDLFIPETKDKSHSFFIFQAAASSRPIRTTCHSS